VNLEEQRQLQEQDFKLIQKTFEANESLKKDKVISDFDYRIEQSKLINKKLTLPQIRSALINNESQQNEKEKEIIELENAIDQQKLIFQQSLSTFKSQLDEWKKKYILIAPISGKVAFASFMQENQQLQVNQPICFINPENSQYFAEIMIPQSNFGKASIGQLVLLKFQSYPFQEYGSVQGRIEFISHIPDEKGIWQKLALPMDLLLPTKKRFSTVMV
jgi:HlyD family secretion protein